MKKLFLTIVTFSILFLIGCQENSVTDPVTNEPTNKVQQDPSHQGTLTFERLLTDPYPVMNSYYLINGEIEYDFSLDDHNKFASVQQHTVSLNLTMSAEFTYLCTVCNDNNGEILVGYINSLSNDTIVLAGNNRYILEKSYLITGREDGMVLICRVIVTTEDVSLAEIFLVLPETELPETES